MKFLQRTLMVTLLAFSSQSLAVDGNQLLSYMNSSNTYEQEAALSYVTGAFDAFTTHIQGQKTLICPPMSVTYEQARDIVKKYLETYPEHRHFPGGNLVIGALIKAYPCN